MTANGNKHKWMRSCLFHSDRGYCCVLRFLYNAGLTGSADSISCSPLCFWLYWTRKDGLLVDIWGLFCSWWSLSLFFLPRVFNFITLTDTLLDINSVKLGNQASSAISDHCLAHRSPPCYWLQCIIHSALLIAEYIHYNLFHHSHFLQIGPSLPSLVTRKEKII